MAVSVTGGGLIFQAYTQRSPFSPDKVKTMLVIGRRTYISISSVAKFDVKEVGSTEGKS